MTQLVLAVSEWLSVGSVIDFFKNINKKLEQRYHYKKTLKELESLSDRELKDIGLNRNAIRSIAMEVYYDNR